MKARWTRLVAVLTLGWASAAVWAGPEEAEASDIPPLVLSNDSENQSVIVLRF